MDERRIKHLEMIQGVINRMAGNSFLIKGWTITLISALFVLADKDTDGQYSIIPFLAIPIFWFLDGYFLSMERQFRELYDHVRKMGEGQIDFSMNTAAIEQPTKNSWICSIWSTTMVLFYLPSFAVVLAVIYLIK
jgi:hypothetical protein